MSKKSIGKAIAERFMAGDGIEMLAHDYFPEEDRSIGIAKVGKAIREHTPVPKREDFYEIECADHSHNSFWKTVVESEAWEEWEQFNELKADRGGEIIWSILQAREEGWISPEHFEAFLNFVKNMGVDDD